MYIWTWYWCAQLQPTVEEVNELQWAPQWLGSQYEAGKVIGICIFQYIRSPDFNPLALFETAYEYKLAQYFHWSKASLRQIDEFFKTNLLPTNLPETSKVCFKSGYTWRNKMRELVMDQPWYLQGIVDFHLQQGYAFYYRDLKSTVSYVLWQRAFAEHLVYEPVRDYDGERNRVYTEMHICDWW